jgi:hypothetical protein
VERARRWKAREQLNRKLGEVTWLPRRDETSCALQDSIVLSTRVCHQIPLSRNRVTLGSVGCVFSEQGYGTGTKGQLLHTAEDDFAGWPVLVAQARREKAYLLRCDMGAWRAESPEGAIRGSHEPDHEEEGGKRRRLEMVWSL